MTLDGTMLAKIEHWATTRGRTNALNELDADGSWSSTTWSEYWIRVRRVGKGLMSLGLQPGECVALVGKNRAAWVTCQHGINAAQGIPAPLYSTLLPAQMAYIIDNAQARIAICDEADQLDKYLVVADGHSPIEHIITMDDLGSTDPRVKTLDELMALGDSIDDVDLDGRLAAVDLDDVALLVYTSGTTGLPKGAMLTHRGIELVGDAVTKVFPVLTRKETRMVSYLPLCHAAEQAVINFAGLTVNAELFFCRELTQIKDYLEKVHPTLFLAVPRVWEKFEAALRAKIAEATGLRAKLVAWALDTEVAAFKQTSETGRPVRTFRRRLANKLVISKIKAALGLDQLDVALSGAAPISTATLEFFASIGVPIHEAYGMTETTAFASVQPYGRPRFGTVGRTVPRVEAKIADDGEIMLRGDNMTRGYFRRPDQSAELYDEQGWMHTGDLGLIDRDGFISITGRKKDLIITAGGKNVAPSEMETYLQAIPGVGQAVVVGDRQPFLCALVALDPEALPALERASGVTGLADVATAAASPQVAKFIESQVDEVCNAKVARYQTIKKVTVLPTVFSIDGGELTPTLKVKRNIVNEKYAKEIAAFYAGGTLQGQPRA